MSSAPSEGSTVRPSRQAPVNYSSHGAPSVSEYSSAGGSDYGPSSFAPTPAPAYDAPPSISGTYTPATHHAQSSYAPTGYVYTHAGYTPSSYTPTGFNDPPPVPTSLYPTLMYIFNQLEDSQGGWGVAIRELIHDGQPLLVPLTNPQASALEADPHFQEARRLSWALHPGVDEHHLHAIEHALQALFDVIRCVPQSRSAHSGPSATTSHHLGRASSRRESGSGSERRSNGHRSSGSSRQPDRDGSSLLRFMFGGSGSGSGSRRRH